MYNELQTGLPRCCGHRVKDLAVCIGILAIAGALVVAVLFLLGRLPPSSKSIAPSTPKLPVIIGMTGQSNGQGEGCCFNSSIDTAPNAMQYVIGDEYSDNTELDPPATSFSGQLLPAIEPLYDGGYNRANIIGPLVALGRAYGDDAILFQAAVGGTSIAWLLTTGLPRLQAGAARINGTFLMFGFVQGETDAENDTPPQVYYSSVQQYFSILRSLPGASSTTPIVIGSMVPDWVIGSGGVSGLAIEDVHRGIPSTIPYTAYVNMPLGYVDYYEPIHFSAAGQRLAGAMMYQALARAMANSEPGLIPDHPTNVTVSSSGLVSWVSSAPLTGYRVVYRKYHNGTSLQDGDASLSLEVDIPAASTSYTLQGMIAGTTYLLDVYAVSGQQISSGRCTSWVIHNAA